MMQIKIKEGSWERLVRTVWHFVAFVSVGMFLLHLCGDSEFWRTMTLFAGFPSLIYLFLVTQNAHESQRSLTALSFDDSK